MYLSLKKKKKGATWENCMNIQVQTLFPFPSPFYKLVCRASGGLLF